MYQLKKKYMKDVRLQKNLRRRVKTQVGEVSSNATHFYFFLQYRLTNYTSNYIVKIIRYGKAVKCSQNCISESQVFD